MQRLYCLPILCIHESVHTYMYTHIIHDVHYNQVSKGILYCLHKSYPLPQSHSHPIIIVCLYTLNTENQWHSVLQVCTVLILYNVVSDKQIHVL